MKHSRTVSLRLQQKKLELEKRSRPSAPPSYTTKLGRKSSKNVTKSCSPSGKQRTKTLNSWHSDEQLSEISNESRSLSCLGNETSLQSNSLTFNSKMEVEVTSN